MRRQENGLECTLFTLLQTQDNDLYTQGMT